MNEPAKKSDKNFSHFETEKLRMTFIDNRETAEQLKDDLRAPGDIVVRVGEYLHSDDPILKDVEIVLQGFDAVVNHAGDELLYFKVKEEDKTILYHLTPHPDARKALHDLAHSARQVGFAIIDSKVHIQQTADLLKQKLAGTLRTQEGTHPEMKYVEKEYGEAEKSEEPA